jgi:hypothetical protein
MDYAPSPSERRPGLQRPFGCERDKEVVQEARPLCGGAGGAEVQAVGEVDGVALRILVDPLACVALVVLIVD